MKFPMDGKPNQRIIVIEPEHHGQPRPYADHERIDLVTIRYYDWRGNIQPHREDYESMMRQHALSAVGGDKYVPVGERKSHSLDHYARTYVESVENVGDHQVRVVIKEPYID